MSPSVIEMRRLTIFKAVVLPHPDGPINTQISPGGTSNVRFSTAGLSLPGYRLNTLRKAISAGADRSGSRPGADPFTPSAVLPIAGVYQLGRAVSGRFEAARIRA